MSVFGCSHAEEHAAVGPLRPLEGQFLVWRVASAAAGVPVIWTVPFGGHLWVGEEKRSVR